MAVFALVVVVVVVAVVVVEAVAAGVETHQQVAICRVCSQSPVPL